MRNKLFILTSIIGLLGLITSCEEDQEKLIMSSNVIPPSIVQVPNLTLERANSADTLTFTGTPVDPGFNASATYFLEGCVTGDNFENKFIIYTGVQDEEIKMSIADLNSVLIKYLPGNVQSSIDLRMRAVLVVDAGTNAPGTGDDPFEYISDPMTVNVTLFGLPRLDIVGTSTPGIIESAGGDGVYTGFVKIDAPFTLLDPDSNTSYGASGETLEVDGNAISTDDDGYHKVTANTNDMTITVEPYFIGLVGSATPNGWDAPDQKMDYDVATGTWYITIDLVAGDIKFRLNDAWAWNLGGTEDNLEHNGANIAVEAGNYTIHLTISDDTAGSEAGTCTIVKNN